MTVERCRTLGGRLVLSALLGLVVAGPFARPASAQEEIQVKGEVVDLACYLPKGSKGPQHRSCAQLCAKKGMPIGVLTESGDLFLLIEDHDDPDPYQDAKKLAGKNAEIAGKRFERDGMSSILVTGVKEQ
jgi:hypothetical protein